MLETIASDPGLQQTELVFLGLFGRGCRLLEAGGGGELAEARAEAASLVELLELRCGSLAAALDGGFPELRSTGAHGAWARLGGGGRGGLWACGRSGAAVMSCIPS